MLKLYNSLTKKKELFKPLQNDYVGMYTCGPTVYNFAHIGNLRTYIFEDVLKRTLLFDGYKVKHVLNITDIGHLTSDADEGEDKMAKGARREGVTQAELALKYTESFFSDLQALNILAPTIVCKATDYISEQIKLIEILEKKGFTYIISDGVYFDTSKDKNYGYLARLDIKGLQEGARVDFNKEKKNITDFALWKFSPKEGRREMEWPSPWGVGFPGWHLECSAMSMAHLGKSETLETANTFDIHCGGIDHLSVHHINEIAQTESATGHKMANFWLHGEFLLIGDDEKMAKSGDNFITLPLLATKGFFALAYRYFVLGAHYRKKLKFSYEALEAAKIALNKIVEQLKHIKTAGKIILPYLASFKQAMEDDLNTPQGLAVLWEVLKADAVSEQDKLATILEMDKVLGLNLENLILAAEEVPLEVVSLAKERMALRKAKDFLAADKLRQQILALGYEVEDVKDGYNLKKI